MYYENVQIIIIIKENKQYIKIKFIFYLFVRKLKSDNLILKKNEEKHKKCLRKNSQLNDEYNQTKAQITKYENSIQQEQKKVKFNLLIVLFKSTYI